MKSYFKISFILVILNFSQFISISSPIALPDINLVNDSTNINGKPMLVLGDNQPLAKISLPSKNMIKRADNEMHRNMKSDLAAYKLFNYSEIEITDADKTITNEFFKSFHLSIDSNLKKSDLLMDDAFKAENINSKLFLNFQEIDNQMNKSFYLSN